MTVRLDVVPVARQDGSVRDADNSLAVLHAAYALFGGGVPAYTVNSRWADLAHEDYDDA